MAEGVVGGEEGGINVGAMVARGEALSTLVREEKGVAKADKVELEDGVPTPPPSSPK
jgi:hypothetical protein